MVEIPGYDIRYTLMSDLPYLQEWVAKEEVLKWFPMTTEKEIEDALQCWIGFAKYSCSLTATVDNVPCAVATLFLMPYRKVAHHCLFKLVVDPAYQKRGIGTSLVRNLKHLAKSYFRLELIHTEVFEGNPLIHILEKNGFTQFARQEGFVKVDGDYLCRVLLECYL